MKNYTSSVPAENTISRIEKLLAKIGSSNIIKSYKDGEVASLKFTVPNPTIDGGNLVIELPANIAAVERILRSKMKRPHADTVKRIKSQAARTAWKLQQDWIEVQVSLIELEQVEALQVFLPYVCCGKQTYYHQLRDGGFKQLPAAKE